MAFFEDRSGAATVEDLLGKAAEAKCPLLMSVVNWGEVYYSVWRARAKRRRTPNSVRSLNCQSRS